MCVFWVTSRTRWKCTESPDLAGLRPTGALWGGGRGPPILESELLDYVATPGHFPTWLSSKLCPNKRQTNKSCTSNNLQVPSSSPIAMRFPNHTTPVDCSGLLFKLKRRRRRRTRRREKRRRRNFSCFTHSTEPSNSTRKQRCFAGCKKYNGISALKGFVYLLLPSGHDSPHLQLSLLAGSMQENTKGVR